MLDYELLSDEGIVRIHPESPLQARDFAALNEMVERYLSRHEKLNGLLITADDLLGWEEFSDWFDHLTFTKNHQAAITRVATISDADLPKLSPEINEYFSTSEIKHFSSNEETQAMSWFEHSTIQ
jgi:hypothetical protein